MKILVFAAARRKGSFNKKLAAQAAEALGALPDVSVDHADFAEFDIPVYDGDLEDASELLPAGVLALVSRIRAADAVVVSTPEYNGGISGAFKNAIDWVSRSTEHGAPPTTGKPWLLLGASPGALGAVRGLWHTRVPLEALGVYVYPEMMGVPQANQAFDEAGKLVDPKVRGRLEKLLGKFVAYAERLTGEKS